jgi:hypothetical protein
LLNEQKRISKFYKNLYQKKEDEIKFTQEKKEKDKETKDLQIQRIRKEIKENNEEKSNLLGVKISLRKQDQEENLKRILEKKYEKKCKLIQKIKESDSTHKTKLDLDLSYIRAQAEIEFKKKVFKK